MPPKAESALNLLKGFSSPTVLVFAMTITWSIARYALQIERHEAAIVKTQTVDERQELILENHEGRIIVLEKPRK